MFQNIDPKTLPENVFFPHWGPVDAGHRRHAGALQHHDRQLGRPGRSLEQAHGHDLRSPPAVYVPVFGGERPVYPLLLLPQWRKQVAHCGAVSGREEG